MTIPFRQRPATRDWTGFERDVLALRPALYAFGRRLARQESDVDDLVQDTLLKALSAQARFEPGSNLKAWLFTIMRNSFNSRWRRSRFECLPGQDAILATAVTPSSQPSELWAREALDRLLHDLSPAHREILILIPVRGLGYEEAAALCGCPVGTVKSRLNRARAALSALVDGPQP